MQARRRRWHFLYGGAGGGGGLATPRTALDLFASTISLADGATVATWDDLSSRAADAVVGGSGANVVLNANGIAAGKPSVHVPTVDRFLISNGNPCPGVEQTWMIVYRCPAGAGASAAWSGNAGLIWADVSGAGKNDYGFSLRADGKFTAGIGCLSTGTDLAALTAGGGFADDAPHLFTFRRNLGDWIIRVDGALEATVSDPTFSCPTDGPTFVGIVGQGFADAATWHLGRITAWPEALSDAAMLAAEAQRMNYYGI